MLDDCILWPAEFARRYREHGYWLRDRITATLAREAAQRGSA